MVKANFSPINQEQSKKADASKLKDHVRIVQLVNMGLYDSVVELINENNPAFNINETDSEGNFAAIVAAMRNDLRMLKLLTNHGADLNLTDGFGRTVKGWAKHYNNVAMLKLIDEIEADKSSKISIAKPSSTV